MLVYANIVFLCYSPCNIFFFIFGFNFDKFKNCCFLIIDIIYVLSAAEAKKSIEPEQNFSFQKLNFTLN
jgi:hypothetical protein